MNIFVLLYNSGTDKEGIHSIELKGRTIVLMFEDKDDATRYCGLLEAQDFPLPTVEMINIEEIKDFCIKLDYEYKLELFPHDALLGCAVEVPTLDGNVTLQVPPKSSTGRMLRLKGRGLTYEDKVGDQYVEILVVIPADINDEEMALYTRLQELSLSDS